MSAKSDNIWLPIMIIIFREITPIKNIRILGSHGGAIMAPPMEMAPEWPRGLIFGTQAHQGILWRYP